MPNHTQDLINYLRSQRQLTDNMLSKLGAGTPGTVPAMPTGQTFKPGGFRPVNLPDPSADIMGGKGRSPKDLALLKGTFSVLANSAGKIKPMAEAMAGMFEHVISYGRLRFDPLQETFGGMQKLGKDMQDVEYETSRAQANAINNLTSLFLGNEEILTKGFDASSLRAKDRFGADLNVLQTYFKNAHEVRQTYFSLAQNMGTEQILQMNKMREEEKVQLVTFGKGLGFTNAEVAKVLDRQISQTGEASNKIFHEISALAHSVSKATGSSFKLVTEDIKNIILDVERFGNVTRAEAARIAGALQQTGVSVRAFGGMVDQFMNFDSAATSMGNLTAAFGIHIDAMEMMMLSIEDPEAMLHRLKDAFHESGQDIMDMNIAQKRLLAQQVGMGVRDIENFFQTGRLEAGMDSLAKATSEANIGGGFETMTQQMVKVRESAKSLEKDAKYMKEKALDLMKTEAFDTGQEFVNLRTKAREGLELGPEVRRQIDAFKQFTDPEKARESVARVAQEFGDQPGVMVEKAENYMKKNGLMGYMVYKLTGVLPDGDGLDPDVQSVIEKAYADHMGRVGDVILKGPEPKFDIKGETTGVRPFEGGVPKGPGAEPTSRIERPKDAEPITVKIDKSSAALLVANSESPAERATRDKEQRENFKTDMQEAFAAAVQPLGEGEQTVEMAIDGDKIGVAILSRTYNKVPGRTGNQRIITETVG